MEKIELEVVVKVADKAEDLKAFLESIPPQGASILSVEVGVTNDDLSAIVGAGLVGGGYREASKVADGPFTFQEDQEVSVEAIFEVLAL